MFKKKQKSLYLALIVIVLIVAALVLFRGQIFGESRNGEILIDHLDENTTIFIDNREHKRIGKSTDDIRLKRIDPGLHTILLSRDGYWPWLKDVEVMAGEVSLISPFLVLSNPTGFLVGESDPDYESLIESIELVALPDFENKKVSSDGSTAIWVDETTLFAEWLSEESERPEYFCNEFGCHGVIVPLGVEAEIRNVEFYKDRSDVFVVAFGNGVFALEADTQNNQNFQPIFEGSSPQFVLSEDENSIYILDANSLHQVAI